MSPTERAFMTRCVIVLIEVFILYGIWTHLLNWDNRYMIHYELVT